MFSQSIELYDLIYGVIKDYRSEAKALAKLLERERPGARAVLDIACGTAEHALHLTRDHGLAVDGIDLEPGFVEIAQRKCPTGRFWVADMTAFDAGQNYDAVLCLFSSIGYVATRDGLCKAFGAMRRHLAPGGIIIVEPWFPPGHLVAGRITSTTAEGNGVTVCRMSHVAVVDRVSRLTFEYLVGRPEGVERAREEHVLSLFSHEEMASAFTAAGLTATHDPAGLTGRGLYIARERPTAEVR